MFKYGNVLELVFQGQFRTRGVAFADTHLLTGKIALTTRQAGVDYYDVETLDVLMGSGTDVVNVTGTTADDERVHGRAATIASTCPRSPPSAWAITRPTSRATSTRWAAR